jgi:hypothetical protein
MIPGLIPIPSTRNAGCTDQPRRRDRETVATLGQHQKKEMAQVLDPHPARISDGILSPDHGCQNFLM